MKPQRHIAPPALAAAAFAVLLAASQPARADDGHGHDHDAPPSATAAALPRFATASEAFELVGVLDGKKLALYLDHAATNEPVQNARLELEIGSEKVAPEAVAAGEFQAVLSREPGDGVTPVTATIAADDESDLLAGELDIHHDAPAAPDGAGARNGSRLTGWPMWCGIGLILLALLFAAVRSGAARRGGAA